MKTKTITISVISGVALLLLVSGAAPLMFGQIAYGCNLQNIMASGEIPHVSEHSIVQKYDEKYEGPSSNTSSHRTLEWGYGTVEYSSFYRDYGNGWLDANLKITINLCGMPQDFQFQCIDGDGNPWITLNDEDEILTHLQSYNCIMEKLQ